jgi:hypothetical protein
MSVSGLCSVCETEPAVEACDRCGTLVCADHREEDSGLCPECHVEIGGYGPGSGSGSPGRERDHPDGVGEYRF